VSVLPHTNHVLQNSTDSSLSLCTMMATIVQWDVLHCCTPLCPISLDQSKSWPQSPLHRPCAHLTTTQAEAYLASRGQGRRQSVDSSENALHVTTAQ
jgi:hypothetical protein